MATIDGKFAVNMTPKTTDDPKLGLITLDKKYEGKLQATGVGHMLTGMTDVPTSAAYVAMEKVTGVLDGKKGSFVIHHLGIMEGENQRLSIKIVPDSGTDELKGIRGTMEIENRDGQHYYKFNYHFSPSD